MTSQARIRREEAINPRPLILILCFIWGIAMGFLLNFFRQPAGNGVDDARVGQNMTASVVDSRTAPAGPERRIEGTPAITVIEPTRAHASGERLSIETMPIPTPAVPLTTDVGLTGRLAAISETQQPSPRPATTPARQPGVPLIPDLDP